jgi:hypothetical protein
MPLAICLSSDVRDSQNTSGKVWLFFVSLCPSCFAQASISLHYCYLAVCVHSMCHGLCSASCAQIICEGELQVSWGKFWLCDHTGSFEIVDWSMLLQELFCLTILLLASKITTKSEWAFWVDWTVFVQLFPQVIVTRVEGWLCLGQSLNIWAHHFISLKLWTHCMPRVGGGIQGECGEVLDSASL